MRHLVLVGLMGAGKTTVGRACAARLARDFVDTDDLVCTMAGATIPEIFASDGEERFREIERRAVADACDSPVPLVVACGGGAVVDPGNRRRLRDAGFVVWLRAPVDVLHARVGEDGGRPLLAPGARDTLTRLALLREDAYSAAAHARVDTENRSVEEVTGAVLDAYAEAAR